jgi:hypothetical protein
MAWRMAVGGGWEGWSGERKREKTTGVRRPIAAGGGGGGGARSALRLSALLTVNLGDAAAALAPDPDVDDAEPLLAQQQQGLLHLGAQGGGLDQVNRGACSGEFWGRRGWRG